LKSQAGPSACLDSQEQPAVGVKVAEGAPRGRSEAEDLDAGKAPAATARQIVAKPPSQRPWWAPTRRVRISRSRART